MTFRIVVAAAVMVFALVATTLPGVGFGERLAAAAVTEEQMLAVPKAYFGDVILTDQNGQQLRFFTDLMRDKVIVVTPFFTRCKNVCPIVTHLMLKAQDELGESFGRDVLFLSLSTDPKYDSPAVILEYIKPMGIRPGWHFLTGDPANIEHIHRKFGFILPSQKEMPPPDQHSTKMYILKAKTGIRVATGSAKMTAKCLVKQVRWAIADTIETEVVTPQC